METNENKEWLAGRKIVLNELLLGQRIKGLQDPSPKVRRKSIQGLLELGKVAARALPLLEALVDDPDRRVREAAAEALKAINEAP
jgi:HEAT repeat protein